MTITLSLDATKLAVKPSGYDPNVHQMMQSVIGKRWHKPWGCWLTPFSKEALDNVKTLLSQVTDVRIDQKVLEALDKQDTRANNVVELKSQAPGVIELPADFTWTTEPMKHQKVAISLGLKNKAFAYFMEMGCVAAQTRILHPDGTDTAIKDLVGKKFSVCSFGPNGELVEGKDAVAFEKGISDIYEVVLSDGKSIRCTTEHVFLTIEGWQYLHSCRVGDALITLRDAFLKFPGSTSVEPAPLVRALNESSFFQTAQDFLRNYLISCRLDDERPHSVLDSGLFSFPLRDGALLQPHQKWRKDAQGKRVVDNHLYQSFSRLSKKDFETRLDSFYRGFCFALKNQERFAHRPNTFWISESRSTLLKEDFEQIVRSLEMDYCINPFQVSRVKSITKVETAPYYDMTVPVHKNYIANGFVNHNTGKTKVMLDLIGYYLPKIREHKKPALIVCPVSVMYNWERQVKIHRPELKVKVLSGNGTKKSEGLQFDADLYVVNYESVWRVFDALNAVKWGFMVLDESTRIKNRGTKQARAILKLGSSASRRYILTGTPSPNSPLELFNQIRFLDPNLFGHNWYFFRDRYCLMGGYGGYQVLGFRNLSELATKISGISYRVLKSECLDLPDKIYKQYRLPMSEKQAKAYKELSEELVTEIAGTEIRTEVVLAKLTKLRQIASGFVYLDGKEAHHFENNKIEKLKELLTEHGLSHKFVVWVSFKEEINLIVKLLNELKMAFEFLDGSVSQENRAKRIQEFQENANVRVFLANQRSGGIGIDLFAADYCVFFSNDYSPEIRLQAEDRLHRIGQRNHVTYIDLISRGSIDSIILRMLSSKQDVSNQVMTGKIKVKEIIYGDDAEF